MSSCNYEMISRAIDNEISSTEKQELEKHLLLCKKCQNYYAACSYTGKKIKNHILENRDPIKALLDLEMPTDMIKAISDNRKSLRSNTIFISRESLPAAAGSTIRFQGIPSEILQQSGYPSHTAIVAEKHQRGYCVYVQSNIGIALTITFLQHDQELCKININNHIPNENNLTVAQIQGWTQIRLEKRP